MRLPKPGQLVGRSRSAVRNPARALVLVLALAVGMVIWPSGAQAHGTIINPASRAYQCWDSWGSQHMNPAMQQEDPMCYQAFQSNPDTMWNWMSALRDNLGGNFQGSTPNGQLCSNGLSRNNSLNQPGQWRTTNVGSNFSIQLYDQASHGSDFFRVYISKQGFNPATQSLGWGDLDFITQTGSYPQTQNVTFNVSTSGYSGHHIVFVIWQAAHLDQTYMWCSDVNFV